jgi:5-methylcytosine-specific restriction endonuclease McrA
MGKRKSISPSLWYLVMSRDGWTCQYCGDHADSVDHILPVTADGKNEESNLVAACGKCNGKASNRVFDNFEHKKRCLLIERFNPSGKLHREEQTI